MGCTFLKMLTLLVDLKVPTLPGNIENLELCHLCFQAWKFLEFALKWGKAGILTPNLEVCKFCLSIFTFQDVIYKNISFTSLSYIHYQYQHCHSKTNWPGIWMLLPGNNWGNTWTLMSSEKWDRELGPLRVTNVYRVPLQVQPVCS